MIWIIFIGLYQEKIAPPFVPGFECAGEVYEIGPDTTTNLKIGDRIISFCPGGAFSEYAIVHQSLIFRLPSDAKSKDLTEAAALTTTYGTAYLALNSRAQIQAGEKVLVTAAAGGVGLACIELASKIFKAKAFAAASSDDKIKIAQSKGAESYGINYKDMDGKSFRAALKPIQTDHGGIDVFVDAVGGELFNAGENCSQYELCD